MFKIFYLAYGSNLNLEQMSSRCPSAKVIKRCNLLDYKLAFKGTEDSCSYLTIEKEEGSFVPVALYSISYFDMLSLDRYEGYPSFYSKVYIPMRLNNKKIKALIYVMNKNFDYHIPSQDYLKTCQEGYQDFNFNEDLLKEALEEAIENLPRQKTK